jgi:hypothetical protein
VLRDAGSSTVIVHSNLLSTEQYTGNSRDICLADGSTKMCKEPLITVNTPSGVAELKQCKQVLTNTFLQKKLFLLFCPNPD